MTQPHLNPRSTSLEDMEHQTLSNLQRITEFYEHLRPENLHKVHELYARDAHFKDPFNDVTGSFAIEHIFDHMFKNLSQPTFTICEHATHGSLCFLSWDFHFHFKNFDTKRRQTIHGVTQLRFTPEGRVIEHIDHWDAAQELYEKIPLLKHFMRWLRVHVMR